jgi:segregation and condensation protein A
MSLLVHLKQFEGPLGLLLYLIRKEEMDIFDINIQEITRQYLEYIQLMRELDLEMAGEFVAMAATLIHIKSRMLLPQYNEHGEEIVTEDPRKELVQRLLEYQKFQEAAQRLDDRPLLNRELWVRARRENLQVDDDSVELEENALFSLIAAYRKAVRMMEKNVHKVRAKVQSISSRVMEMKAQLVVGLRLKIAELLSVEEPEGRRRQLLITFLAMLELGKMGYVRLFQADAFSDIYIEPQKSIEHDVLTRVEEYDSVDAEGVANKLLVKAAGEAIQAQLDREDQDVEVAVEDASIEAATDEEIALAEAEFEDITQADSDADEPSLEAFDSAKSRVADFDGDTSSINTEVIADEVEADEELAT